MAVNEKPKRRTLLLNLPFKVRLIRRYMCSYQSPNILYPPLELLALGGIVREWKGGEAVLLDAVAERLGLAQVLARIESLRPDLIVTLTGFECLDSDADAIRAVKARFPALPLAVFGYYPTQFPEAFLDALPIDAVILGEPDLVFSDLYDSLLGAKPIEEVAGIARREGSRVIVQGGPRRVEDLDRLPRPAHELLDLRRYSEPFFPRPYGAVQSARGCPFACTFCVRSYGRRLVVKSPDRILEEVRFLKERHGLRALRFTDDTFTAIPARAADICRLLEEADLGIVWSCLSRADTLSADLLDRMSRAGCRRIFLGIESGSARMLGEYGKGLDVERALANVRLCRRHGIETMGFLVVGAPGESERDFRASLDFVLRSGLDYYSGTELIAYPGTELFERHRDEIDFSLFPYRNRFKDAALEARQRRWKKLLYRRFYLRPGWVARHLRRLLAHPRELAAGAAAMLRFLVRRSPLSKRDELF